jgi:predicted Zn-dependent peptidase
VGNVSFKRIAQLLETHLSDLALTAERPNSLPFANYQPFHIRRTEANYQAHALIGGMAPGYNSEDRIPMSLLINLLGGPALNSRLNLSIREKYGLVYSVEASYTPYAETGFWQVYFGSEQRNLHRALDLVYKELKTLERKALTGIQLHRAKQQLKGHLALGMDSNAGLMQGLGKSMLAFNQLDTLAEMHQGIDKITADQIQDMASRFFTRDLCSSLVFECPESED